MNTGPEPGQPPYSRLREVLCLCLCSSFLHPTNSHDNHRKDTDVPHSLPISPDFLELQKYTNLQLIKTNMYIYIHICPIVPITIYVCIISDDSVSSHFCLGAHGKPFW
jgi:hypothetical protein